MSSFKIIKQITNEQDKVKADKSMNRHTGIRRAIRIGM